MKNKAFLLTLLAAGCASALSMNDIIFWKLVRSTDADYIAKATTNSLGGKADKTNSVLVGTMTLTNTTSTAWSVGYWTNSITGVGTNGVYVRKVYTLSLIHI